nr:MULTISPECIES: alternate-type signal peptide domain-containing protein [unclassified Leucobacter]
MRFGITQPRVEGAKTSRRARLIAGIGIAGLAVLGTGGVTYALWNAQSQFSGGNITAGDLDLSYGDGTWAQITPGVDDPAGGLLSEGSDGFHSMPGDVIEFRVPLTTELQGDNLNARMNVAMGSAANADLRDGRIAATYVVEDATGAPASAHALPGTPVDVAGLIGTNAGVSAHWTVVMTVEVLGDYTWTDEAPLDSLDAWSIGGIDVTLEQVRSGTGFTDGEG